MKIISLLLSFLLIVTITSAQEQFGLIRELNSNSQPIPNVQVKFIDAVPTTSDDEGSFKLVFNGKSIGDPIFFEAIRKQGYELVNEKEIQVLKIGGNKKFAKDIILAKQGSIANNRKKYYNISDRILNKNFERERKDLKEKLNESKISKGEHQQNFHALNQAYDRQQKKLYDLANTFARINFDDVSEDYKSAFKLFEMEKVDESLKVLEDLQLIDRAKKRIDERIRLKKAERKVVSQEERNEREIEEDIKGIQLQAQLYVLKFEVKKAEKLYDRLLELDSTDLVILSDASNFYRENYINDKIEPVSRKIIENENSESWQIANAYAYIGEFYYYKNDFTRSLENHKKSYELYEKLVDNNVLSFFNKRVLSITAKNIGKIYQLTGKLNLALQYFEKSNQIDFGLYNNWYPRSEIFGRGLAQSYSYIGDIYTEKVQFDKALEYYRKSHEAFEEILKIEPQNLQDKNNASVALQRLGTTHFTLGKIEEAYQYFNQSHRINTELKDTNPSSFLYRKNFASGFISFGDIDYELGKIDLALNNYKKAEKIFEDLKKEFPLNIEADEKLIASHQKIGNIYKETGDIPNAKKYYEKVSKLAYEVYDENKNNLQIKHSLVNAYSEAANLYSFSKDSLNSLIEQLIRLKALTLVEELVKESPENLQYKLTHAKIFSDYSNFHFTSHRASFYNEKEDLSSAFEYASKANVILVEQYKKHPKNKKITEQLSLSYYSIGDLFLYVENIEESLKYFTLYNHLIEDLSEDFPQKVELKNALAISYSKLGDIYALIEDYETTMQFYSKENLLFISLNRSFPKNTSLKHGLGVSYGKLAEMNYQQNELNAAMDFYTKKRQIFKELFEQTPLNNSIKEKYGSSNAELGNVYQKIDKMKKAKELFQEAQRIFQELSEEEPNIRLYRDDLFQINGILEYLNKIND